MTDSVSYIDFAEERLKLGINYGAIGGLSFSTEIIENAAGDEQRNALWWLPSGRWQLGERMLLDSAYDRIQEVQYLRSFHSSKRGSKTGFRFKDWSDYQAFNQELGVTDGVTNMWYLRKTYSFGQYSTFRPITKPVEDTVRLYLDGNEIDYPLINYTNGLVSFAVPPQSGQLLTADFEFDVPVQFEADKIEWTLEAIQLEDGSTLHKLGSIFVKEMRLNLDSSWVFAPIPQIIKQPIDLGFILNTSETITFDTRSESLQSGYVSNQSNNNSKTVVKLPSYRFNQEQLDKILNLFWVAKGRLCLFFVSLNSKVYFGRFNSDSLSIKFVATERTFHAPSLTESESESEPINGVFSTIDSLYEVNLEFDTFGGLSVNETYIKAVVDDSGSMNGYTEPIESAISLLREIVKVAVYRNNEELTSKYFKGYTLNGTERWLSWINEDLRDDESEPSKHLFLAWINEASPYHTPGDNGPTSAFNQNLDSFLASYPERKAFKAIIYSVFVDSPSIQIQTVDFDRHLISAVEGKVGYTTALQNYGVVARTKVDSNTNAIKYLKDIFRG